MITMARARKYSSKRGWIIVSKYYPNPKYYEVWAYKETGKDYVAATNRERAIAIQAVFNSIILFEATK